jgi:hypothetical protein
LLRTIDRKKLGPIVFHDKSRMEALNAIVWPAIEAMADAELRRMRAVRAWCTTGHRSSTPAGGCLPACMPALSCLRVLSCLLASPATRHAHPSADPSPAI